MQNFLSEMKLRLDSLTIYRSLLQDEVISKLCLVLNDLMEDKKDVCGFLKHYAELCYKLAEKTPDLNLYDYLTEIILFDDNVFSRACERGSEYMNDMISKAAQRDLESLYHAAFISSEDIKQDAVDKFKCSGLDKELIHSLPEWTCGIPSHDDSSPRNLLKLFQHGAIGIMAITDFYRSNGAGQMARYRGFVWEKDGADGILRGIPSPDPVRFSDLIGYAEQKEELIDNTLQFIKGYSSNNVLLYGPRGTGKSSAVKALINEYGHLGLRMIELPKSYLNDLHHILRIIKDRPQKFIIFIDDLVFGDNEAEYTSLKAVLEGGLESKPKNVLIYATSNRRHLIKERFSDRHGFVPDDSEDDVHAGDTMQEKLSLADRFGLTITFPAPNQRKFLEIVDGIAKNRNLRIDPETLHREALIWEMRYNGRSGRTARQFIDWMEGRYGLENR